MTLPAAVAKQLNIKDGDSVEAVVKRGKLVLHKRQDAASELMKYAGIWHDEDVDKALSDVRKGWSIWQKKLSA